MTITERDERLALAAVLGYRSFVYHEGRGDAVLNWRGFTDDEREVWVRIARAVDDEIALEIAGEVDSFADFTGRGL